MDLGLAGKSLNKIMLIGQDWGSFEKYYLDYKGNHKDKSKQIHAKELFELIGIDIGLPSKPNKNAHSKIVNFAGPKIENFECFSKKWLGQTLLYQNLMFV